MTNDTEEELDYSRLEGMSAVLIDDDTLFSRQVITMLEDVGMEVFRARNGESGIKLCRRVHPDFALCDYPLPDLEYEELTSALKLCRVPRVVAFSSVQVSPRVANELQGVMGVSAVLQKPIREEQLLQVLENIAPSGGESFVAEDDSAEGADNGIFIAGEDPEEAKRRNFEQKDLPRWLKSLSALIKSARNNPGKTNYITEALAQADRITSAVEHYKITKLSEPIAGVNELLSSLAKKGFKMDSEEWNLLETMCVWLEDFNVKPYSGEIAELAQSLILADSDRRGDGTVDRDVESPDAGLLLAQEYESPAVENIPERQVFSVSADEVLDSTSIAETVSSASESMSPTYEMETDSRQSIADSSVTAVTTVAATYDPGSSSLDSTGDAGIFLDTSRRHDRSHRFDAVDDYPDYLPPIRTAQEALDCIIVSDDSTVSSELAEVARKACSSVNVFTDHETAIESIKKERIGIALICLPEDQTSARRLTSRYVEIVSTQRSSRTELVFLIGEAALHTRIVATHQSFSHLAPLSILRSSKGEFQTLLEEISFSGNRPGMLVFHQSVERCEELSAALETACSFSRSTCDPDALLQLIDRSIPEIIFVGERVNELSGFDICRMIRRTARSRSCVIVLELDEINSETVRSAQRAGADLIVSSAQRASSLAGEIVDTTRRLIYSKPERGSVSLELSPMVLSDSIRRQLGEQLSDAARAERSMTLISLFSRAAMPDPDSMRSIVEAVISESSDFANARSPFLIRIDTGRYLMTCLDLDSKGVENLASLICERVRARTSGAIKETGVESSFRSYPADGITISDLLEELD